jgi:hypothetical protein
MKLAVSGVLRNAKKGGSEEAALSKGDAPRSAVA